jgi:hypothetical protein
MLARSSKDNNLQLRLVVCWSLLGATVHVPRDLHDPQFGQTERVNQTLEDIIRACVLEHQGSWDQNLPWAEFSYNNSY